MQISIDDNWREGIEAVITGKSVATVSVDLSNFELGDTNQVSIGELTSRFRPGADFGL